jgi:hypothetical protein
MNRTTQAKVRSRRRASNAGAVIFITSVTLALLATVGGFAILSASNEAQTSGSGRRAMQSQYLAEYALLAVAANMTPAYATSRNQELQDPTKWSPGCANQRGVPVGAPNASKACVRLGREQLSGGWTNTTPIALRAKSGTTTGSLGLTDPMADDGTGRPVGADFYVELSEATPVKVSAGNQVTSGPGGKARCSIRFTVDAFGITRPGVTLGTNDTHRHGAMGLVQSHAYIVSPPNDC